MRKLRIGFMGNTFSPLTTLCAQAVALGMDPLVTVGKKGEEMLCVSIREAELTRLLELKSNLLPHICCITDDSIGTQPTTEQLLKIVELSSSTSSTYEIKPTSFPGFQTIDFAVLTDTKLPTLSKRRKSGNSSFSERPPVPRKITAPRARPNTAPIVWRY
jgi:hypothetical protein